MKTAREVVHDATRTANKLGACNLFHCAFDDEECCIPCVELQAVIEQARGEGAAANFRRGQESMQARAAALVSTRETTIVTPEGIYYSEVEVSPIADTVRGLQILDNPESTPPPIKCFVCKDRRCVHDDPKPETP